jgi:aminopeptidase
MDSVFIKKYAHLLLNYCMELSAGQKLLVSTTTLALPLVSELFIQCQKMGVIMETILEWEGKSADFNEVGNEAQASYINPLYKEAMTPLKDIWLSVRPLKSPDLLAPTLHCIR